MAYVRAALIALIGWGAFAFGAVYPWAYWPLAIAGAALGLAGWFGTRVERPSVAPLAACICVFLLGCALQLAPLPIAWLVRLSPNAAGVLNVLDPLFANGLTSHHALSLVPVRTLVSAVVILCVALLMLGTARLFSQGGATAVTVGITVIGVGLALDGVVQRALFNGKIYGLWQTETPSSPFGPFANHNHFAGWMLMAIPLTAGLLAGRIARTVPYVRPGWRNRILWLGSADASQIGLLVAAIVAMSLAMAMTGARSGLLGLMLAVTILGGTALRTLGNSRARIWTVGALGAMTILILLSVGPDVAGGPLVNTDWRSFNDRRGPWIDGLSVVRAFPVFGTGLNTYGVAMAVYQRHALDLHYEQAHNDYLQLAAEGGALLVIPFAAATFALIAAIRRATAADVSARTFWLRTGAIAGLAAIALQEGVDFSLQMPGNAVLFAVLCAIAVHRGPRPLLSKK